jgi:hypothetical protein
MKICRYCGKDFPDDAVVCPIDHEPLEISDNHRQDITGNWIGSYSYPWNPGLEPVPFTLKLQQDKHGHFSGTVTEDADVGMPGTGTIDGRFTFPRIDFVKRMPVCYMAAGTGRRVKLREWLATLDLVCEGDPPHPPVAYEGRFYEINEARGTWTIKPWEISLVDGMSVPMGEVSGAWVIKFKAE